MSPKRSLLALLSLIAALFSPMTAAALPLPAPDALPVAESLAVQPRWTVWGAEQYALADDGASIWIGSVGGVTQWDKHTETYRRYSTVDGLPQTQVLAITLDAAGNRWFGGIGGLSRLDKDGAWTHYTTANSGIRRNDIDALAVVGGDTLYAGHGPDDGSVSRLAPDGTWQWFPNRAAAIVTDYAAITGRGSTVSALWTVAGAEVWMGKWAFDGSTWHDRSLPDPYEITGLVADGQNHVWATIDGWGVYEWDGLSWVTHDKPHAFTRHITVLAVDRDGKVWAGLTERFTPYGSETAVVREATGANGHSLSQYGPVSALLSTPEGLWAVGPGWLMTPDFEPHVLPDMPRYQDVLDAMIAQPGPLWLASGRPFDDWAGAVQTLDDRGTLSLDDDSWRDNYSMEHFCRRATAFERFASDVWYATYCHSRTQYPTELTRYHDGVRIEYTLPSFISGDVTDIFALDERHIWFAVISDFYGGNDCLVGLDDGGTPADVSDDQWQIVKLESWREHVTVAVDAQGPLWRGEDSGLYRYDGAAWQRIYDERAVCDLVPGPDGTLFAQVEYNKGGGCETASDFLIMVRPGGEISLTDTDWLLSYHEDVDVVRTMTRRNNLWTVSADGALWYLDIDYPQDVLRRISRKGEEQSYALPVNGASVLRVEVDASGHVWLVGDGKLWRMEGPAIHRLFLPTLTR